MESLLNVGGDDHCQILSRGVGETVSEKDSWGLSRYSYWTLGSNR